MNLPKELMKRTEMLVHGNCRWAHYHKDNKEMPEGLEDIVGL